MLYIQSLFGSLFIHLFSFKFCGTHYIGDINLHCILPLLHAVSIALTASHNVCLNTDDANKGQFCYLPYKKKRKKCYC